MNIAFKSVRGMPDILPEACVAWQHVEALWRLLIAQYGYREIRLPVIEVLPLFKRSIGEATDIVEKEMFVLYDRDNTALCLRPEGTAGCVRAMIEHGLLHNQIQKLWYQGPMFRYERPQKGRYRQFNQIGVECFGLDAPFVEVEHIALMNRFWGNLQLRSKVVLEINHLGDTAARAVYRQKLIEYFERFRGVLDEDCTRRLYTNPLRILDSKNPQLQDIISGAPKILEYIDEGSHASWLVFKAQLEALNIHFVVNTRLVRGLDYYNGIVYEWVTDLLGAQGTLCAGGRFDTLVEQLGGKSCQAVGFAMGVERILLLLETQNTLPLAHLDGYLVVVGEAAKKISAQIAEIIRSQCPGLSLYMGRLDASVKSQFKHADKLGARFAFILSEDEIATQEISVKFLRLERAQISIKISELNLDFLNEG